MSNRMRANLIAFVALFVALGGGVARAANTVSSLDIINGEVKSVDIGTGQVKTPDISPANVTEPKLADGAVTGTKVADGAIATTKLLDGAITTAKLADGAVNGAKVLDNSLTGADVANTNSLRSPEISGLTGADIDDGTLFNDNSLTTADLADAAVTIPKLDFDPATQAEFDQLATDDGDPPNTGSNLVNWNRLVGVPADIADGDFAGWSLGGNAGTTGTDFLGTTDDQPLELRVNGARAMRLEPASDGANPAPNVIGGSADNSITSGVYSATIAGGGRSFPPDPATANRVTDHLGVVGGGSNNQAGDGAGTTDDRALATVAGGGTNVASGFAATVAGGYGNVASGDAAAIMGANNTASEQAATVVGGQANTASAFGATVAGGAVNTAQGENSLAGGLGARAQHNGSFVWADSAGFFLDSTAQDQFSVRAVGGTRFVSGIDGSGSPTSGLELPANTSGWATLTDGQPLDLRVNGMRGFRLDPASFGGSPSPNLIAGSADNAVTSGVHSATIGGGGRSVSTVAATANLITDHGGTVSGGSGNKAGDGAGTLADRAWATVAGGVSNEASGADATVSGGSGNAARGQGAAIAGGEGNFALGVRAAVGGGLSNRANQNRSTVAGGQGNTVDGTGGTIGGGSNNNVGTGLNATVPGGNLNTAGGATSLAAGFGARATHDGAFVWGDSQNAFVDSTKANQFLARANGGFFFENDSTVDDQGGFINTGTGAFLSTGGAWTNASDKHLKAGFESVDPRRILNLVTSLPVRRWHYKAEPDVRHVGPGAQDFYRAFGVGEDRRHIASVDADGVALAAIKGLSRKLLIERRRRQTQERRLDRLEARLAALERDAGGR